MATAIIPQRNKSPITKLVAAGAAYHTERALEGTIMFVDWYRSRRHAPTPQDIQTHLGCSRATAYRYIAAFRNAGERARA